MFLGSINMAAAQTDADAIQALVKNGQNVSITTESDGSVGRIGTMTADTLSITTRRERTTVPYRQIVRIGRPPDGSRKRREDWVRCGRNLSSPW